MKIERMEVLGVTVHDIDKAMAFFSNVLGVQFLDFQFGKDVMATTGNTDVKDAVGIDFGTTRIAIDPTGYLELIQTGDSSGKEGFRNIHFKVPNLEEAKAELRAKGVRLVGNYQMNGLKEAVFHHDDLYGIRLCLVEYDAPSLIESIVPMRK